MNANPSESGVRAVRSFNGFYTRQIGVLQEGLLSSPFSLTEVRVLYELAHGKNRTASALGEDLGLDAGYLSRILKGFEKRGLLSKSASKTDGRQVLLSLTKQGQKVLSPLEERSNTQVSAMLSKLALRDRKRLVEAMQTVRELLNDRRAETSHKKPLFSLRRHRPGDMGWVVHRHGLLYSKEYGYDERFEALVAQIVAEFIEHFDAKRERCWIAEREQEILGCVFLVKKTETVAKLRLLLVEPTARGLGLGKRLVSECVGFAREAGYRKIVLWTQSELDAARHLYAQAGFRIVGKEPHKSFGRQLVAETWELAF
jgi:DNA-binding MarR family transcriptional regulator/N-acetylglutamate synthase-like GNAT family acetyltransferase